MTPNLPAVRQDSTPNPSCARHGIEMVDVTIHDFFGPGYHYFSLRCPECQPDAPEEDVTQ